MLINGVETSWEDFLKTQKSASRDPLRLSEASLIRLDERYPREGKHENVELAEMLDAVSQFERFEKRNLTEDELKLFKFAWRDRGARDYLELVHSGAPDKPLAAVLRVGNRQYVTQGQANAQHRPFGMTNLNP